MRDESAIRRDQLALLAGIATALAFLLPLLGRQFAESTGVHPRLIGYGALAWLVVLSAMMPPTGAFRPAAHKLHVVVLGLLLCVLALFPWSGPVWVLDDPLSVREYAGYKLTRLITLAVPTTLVGVIARRFVSSDRFVLGLTWTTTAIAVLALGQLAMNRGAVSSSQLSDLTERASFSTISLSLVFVFLQITWAHRYLSERRGVWRPIVASVVAMLGAFMLTQRTAMMLIVAFGLFLGFRDARGRARSIGLGLCVAFGLWIMLDVAAVDVDTSGLVAQFPAQIRRVQALLNADDASSSARLVMWEFGWNEGWRVPEGHGVGAFAQYFPANRYPHNVFIEGLFELGVPGALLVVGLLAITARTLWKLFRSPGATLVALALLALLAYALKAGDFSLAGNWLCWLYLGHGWLEGEPSRPAPTLELPAIDDPCAPAHVQRLR